GRRWDRVGWWRAVRRRRLAARLPRFLDAEGDGVTAGAWDPRARNARARARRAAEGAPAVVVPRPQALGLVPGELALASAPGHDADVARADALVVAQPDPRRRDRGMGC